MVNRNCYVLRTKSRIWVPESLGKNRLRVCVNINIPTINTQNCRIVKIAGCRDVVTLSSRSEWRSTRSAHILYDKLDQHGSVCLKKVTKKSGFSKFRTVWISWNRSTRRFYKVNSSFWDPRYSILPDHVTDKRFREKSLPRIIGENIATPMFTWKRWIAFQLRSGALTFPTRTTLLKG